MASSAPACGYPGHCLLSRGLLQCHRCRRQTSLTSRRAGRQHRQALIWVDTMLGNVKSAMQGTYHAIRAKHLPRYLAEFSYRFNRRFDLAGMVGRLGRAAAVTPPMPYRLVRLAEAHW